MSSGGGLIQLIAYGAQDVYLTGNPQSTLWKQSFHRKTNYALESIQQVLMGTVNYGSSATVTLARSGDLVCGLMAEVTMIRGPSTAGTPEVFYPAEALFESIELRIGGQLIDTLYHNWFRLYDELFYDAKQTQAYADMMNFTQEIQGQARTFYFPIPFFFCSMLPGLALPLIALQYHEVELKFNFAKAADIQGVDTSTPPVVKIYADYVFVDTAERTSFAQKPHEYLVTQLQYQNQGVRFSNVQTLRYGIPLNFNHPTKMVSWVFTQPGIHGQFTALQGATQDNTAAPLARAGLQLNGRERFTTRPGKYFTNAQPWLCQRGNYYSSGVYAYHFGLNNVVSHQPSQTLNFSRIDNAILVLHTKINNVPGPFTSVTSYSTNEDQTYEITSNLQTVEVYAQNYNVLRVMSGMGGLAFAN
jgi:hypothetical protein